MVINASQATLYVWLQYYVLKGKQKYVSDIVDYQ